MSHGATHATTRSLSSAVGLAFCVQTVISFLAAFAPVIAVEIAATRQWNVNAIAFYLPLAYATAFAVSFAIPGLLARFGPIRVGIACVAAAAAGQLALLAPDWRVAILAALIIGLAIGGMNPVTSQILSPYASPRNASVITAIKQTGVPLGAAAAGLIGPALVYAGSWQAAVTEVVVVALVLAAWLIPAARKPGQEPQKCSRPAHPLEPIKQLVAIPGMIAIIVAAIAYVIAQHCLRSFFTIYLVRELGLTLSVAGLAFTFSQVTGIAGQLFWAAMSGRVMTHNGVLAVIGMLMALASGATAFAAATWNLVLVLGLAGLFGFTAAGFIPVVLGAVLVSSSPSQAGALTSALNMFVIGSALLGPIAFGAIAEGFGYSGAFIVLAVVCMAGAASCALGHIVARAKSSQLGQESLPAA